MCAKVAGVVLKVLSDLLGHENHEVFMLLALGWTGGCNGNLGACDLTGNRLALGSCCI